MDHLSEHQNQLSRYVEDVLADNNFKDSTLRWVSANVLAIQAPAESRGEIRRVVLPLANSRAKHHPGLRVAMFNEHDSWSSTVV